MFQTEWLRTATCQPLDCETDLFWGAITQMYMVDSDRGVNSQLSPYNAAKYSALHTNSGGYCPRPCDGYQKDISDAGLEEVKGYLRTAPGSGYLTDY